MRVAGIELINHPGIGNLSVDFRMPDGSAPRHVVIAGGNGSGKTAVLEAIFAAMMPADLLLNSQNLKSGGSARVLVELDGNAPNLNLGEPISPEIIEHIRAHWAGFNGYIIDLDWENGGQYAGRRQIYNIRTNTSAGRGSQISEVLDQTLACFYSSAQAEFTVPPIRSVTAVFNPNRGRTPVDVEFPLFGGANLASKIPQLFVDIDSADGSNAIHWLRQNADGRPPAGMIAGRLANFADAFQKLIPHKRFLGIRMVDGELKPIFTDGDRETPIAKLSTGEKQIVFRGAFLLSQKEHLSGTVVLIDEPEISLHPAWQSGILAYYDEIVQESEALKSQIIVATHSPFVVHGSLTAKHIILRRSPEGRVYVDPAAGFPDATANEVAIAAFDLNDLISTSRGNRMVVATEGKTDAQMIRIAWEKLRPGRPMLFDLMPAGSAGSLRQFLGHEANAPGPLADMMASRGVDRVLGLFDFDKEGHGWWLKGRKSQTNIAGEDLALTSCPWWRRTGTNVWSALLPVPNHRSTAATLGDGAEASMLTTELLFEDAYLHGMVRAVQVRHAPVGITRPEASNAQKTQIAEAAQRFEREAFAPFEPLLVLIERILQAQL